MNYTIATVKLPTVREAKGRKNQSPAEMAENCKDMKSLAQETFQILTLNGRNQIINRHLITLGLLDSSLVHPREVFRPAIQDSAASIILLHNHPSGITEPSEADKVVTSRLVKCGELLEIKVLDHLIIATDGFFSFLEKGLLNK